MSGIPAWAIPGAKVRCVRGGPHIGFGIYCPNLPETGQTYTVRGVRDLGRGDAGLWLEEVKNNPVGTVRGVYEPGWVFDRFEPAPSEPEPATPAERAVAEHDAIKKAAFEGYGVKTAAQLADELGVSRNTIIGHWYRFRKSGLLPRQDGEVA